MEIVLVCLVALVGSDLTLFRLWSRDIAAAGALAAVCPTMAPCALERLDQRQCQRTFRPLAGGVRNTLPRCKCAPRIDPHQVAFVRD